MSKEPPLSAGAISVGAPLHENILLQFLYRRADPLYCDLSLDEKRS
jgi:hypothetical protein